MPFDRHIPWSFDWCVAQRLAGKLPRGRLRAIGGAELARSVERAVVATVSGEARRKRWQEARAAAEAARVGTLADLADGEWLSPDFFDLKPRKKP